MHLDIVNVTGTSIDDDGFQSTQWDAEGEGLAGVAGGQAHHAFGSWGRAPDAVSEPTSTSASGGGQIDPSKSAQALLLTEGGIAHLFDLQHVPTVGKIPIINGGEHVTYSSSGCFSRHHDDGAISHATTDASGQSIVEWIRPDGFSRFGGFGRETFDGNGYRINTSGGARLTLGFISGLPAPMSGGQSYARIQAQLVEINGSAITIGPTGAAAQPVAQAPQLASILGTLAAAIQALQLAMATITTTTPGATAAGASAAAVEAAVSAASGALLAIATQTVFG